MIFDGECAFCRLWVRRWEKATAHRVAFIESQKLGDRAQQIPREVFSKTVVLIENDGTVLYGADAVFRLCDFTADSDWRLLKAIRRIPGGRSIARLVYRIIAANRPLFSKLTARFTHE
jgi:predicted DCC family thiol-disulfide oxidoreductase YuxK